MVIFADGLFPGPGAPVSPFSGIPGVPGTRGLDRKHWAALRALPAPLLPLPRAGSECPASPAAHLALQLPTRLSGVPLLPRCPSAPCSRAGPAARPPPALTGAAPVCKPGLCMSERALGKELDSPGPVWGSSAVGEAVSEPVLALQRMTKTWLWPPVLALPTKVIPGRFPAGSVYARTRPCAPLPAEAPSSEQPGFQEMKKNSTLPPLGIQAALRASL